MEDELRTLLHGAAPTPSDPDAFRLKLNARIATAEQIKEYCDREYRRDRRILLSVFIAGILLGTALTVVMFLHPIEWPSIQDIIDISRVGSLLGTDPSRVMVILGGIVAALAIALPLGLTRHYRFPE